MKISLPSLDLCTRDPSIHLDSAGRSARLAPSVLVHNEEGVAVQWPTQLSSDEQALVLLELPPGRARGAQLLWYINYWATPLSQITEISQQRPNRPVARPQTDSRSDDSPPSPTIFVNGHAIKHQTEPAAMLTGGWDRCAVPARFLRPGVNRIIFSNAGCLYVDPTPPGSAPPQSAAADSSGQSFRSFDGGKTWHAHAMGPEHNAGGEFLVRLRVLGAPSQGVVTSPVIDLAQSAGKDKGAIAPACEYRDVQLNTRAATPKGTAIDWEIRSGSTPQFHPRQWSPWQAGTSLARGQRFVQWRATLRSSLLHATPVLKQVSVGAVAGAAKSTGAAAQPRVIHCDRPVLARPSLAFTYLEPHPLVERLIQQWRIDKVIARGKSDLEKLILLRDWVHKQWYGWQSAQFPHCPSWDPLDILETAKHNWGYGMCTHYSALFSGCAAALGFAARSVIIDHHCVNEAFVAELDKWVYFDPSGFDNSIVELGGVPLNALEIQQAIRQGKTQQLDVRMWQPSWMHAPAADIRSGPTPVHGQHEYVTAMRPKYVALFERFGICLRNNHLVEPLPAEKEHGQEQYHWNGYLWWLEQQVPRYPEYSRQTKRVADLYWSVGATAIHLQQGAVPQTVTVLLEHSMPSFAHFQVRQLGQAWQQVDCRWDWPLTPGRNELEVQAVSRFGKLGKLARAVVEV